MYKKIFFVGLFISFLLLNACASIVKEIPVKQSEYNDIKEAEKIVVTTKDNDSPSCPRCYTTLVGVVPDPDINNCSITDTAFHNCFISILSIDECVFMECIIRDDAIYNSKFNF